MKGGTGWPDVEEKSGGAFIFKKIKRKELNKKKKKKSPLNPGLGWTCPRGGFFGRPWHRWQPPMAQRAVASPAEAPGPPALDHQDNLRTQTHESKYRPTGNAGLEQR